MSIEFEISEILKDDEFEKFLKALRSEISNTEIEELAHERLQNNSGLNIEDEKIQIRKEKTEEVVSKNLRKIILAAANESIEIILGKQVNNRADDFLTRKIYHLIKCYYTNRMPTESEIVSMFQVTETTARRLLRDLRAANRNDLENEINESVKAILLQPIEKSENNYIFLIRSENILEEIKQTVSIEAAELDQVQKQKNSACSYLIPTDTYRRLCNAYNLDFDTLVQDL